MAMRQVKVLNCNEAEENWMLIRQWSLKAGNQIAGALTRDAQPPVIMAGRLTGRQAVAAAVQSG